MENLIFDVTGDWEKYEGRCILHPKFKTFQVYGGYDKAQRWKAVGAFNSKDEKGEWHTVAKNVEILKAMAKIRGPIALDPAASARFKELNGALERSHAASSDIEFPCPEGLSYLPYQKAGIQYAIERIDAGMKGALISDEMGLGKTIQAIGLANARPDIKRVIVVCPASVKINWLREANKWLVGQWTYWAKPFDTAANFIIINYDVLGKYSELFNQKYDLVIFDESQYLKNGEAKRTKLALGSWDKQKQERISGLIDQAKYAIMLTGTPVLNRPVELWSTICALAPGRFGSFMTYATKFCAAYHDRFGFHADGASNMADLQLKLRTLFMVRRLKKDVLKELPPKIRQVIEIEGDPKIVAEEQTLWNRFQDEMDEIRANMDFAKASGNKAEYEEHVKKLQGLTEIAFTEMAKIRHILAVKKVPYVVEHLRNVLENTNKIVVFAHHRDVVEQLAEELKEFGVVTLTGGDDMDQRQFAVDSFQKNANVRVFIGNIKAAGIGLTLTAASTVIFAELSWVPADISQAEDRCHRLTQTESVLVQHIVLDGSFDAMLARTLVEKQRIIDAALDDPTEIDIPVIPMPKGGWVLPSKFPQVPENLKTVVHEGLRMIARMCDGAHEKDGSGFNKLDTNIGKKISILPNLTDGQAVLAAKLVNKYRIQIGGETGAYCQAAKEVMSLKHA